MSGSEVVVTLPFNQHVGLSVAADGAVQMPDDPRLTNHVGTRHAGALFTLGEAASGAALLDALGPKLAELSFIVRTARIDYLKPARGVLVGKSVVDGAAALARVDEEGKADLDVPVELVDGAGVVVARLVVTWVLRRARS